MISAHCREITLDFFEKVSLAWEDAPRHTVCFMLANVLLDLLYLTVKIFSHQQSPGVVHQEVFVTRFKIEKTDHIPSDYLVTIFSFGRLIRQGNPSYRIFKSRNNIIAIFAKSTPYCPCLKQIILDGSGIETWWQRAKKWGVEQRRVKVIHIYPTNPALQCFDKVKIVQTKFLQDIQDESEHFGGTS